MKHIVQKLVYLVSVSEYSNTLKHDHFWFQKGKKSFLRSHSQIPLSLCSVLAYFSLTSSNILYADKSKSLVKGLNMKTTEKITEEKNVVFQNRTFSL